MKLMTAALLKSLPPLYSTEEVPTEQKKAVAKFFDPTGRMTYYVIEGSKEEDDVIFFGYMVSPLGPDCDEYGNSSLNELQAVKGRFGLGIERDLHFTPTLMSEILAKVA
jgi:hypothetical protein